MDPKIAPTADPGAVKPTEKVVEIKAVDKQASNLLEIVNDINGQLDAARTLRLQRDGDLSEPQRVLIDSTVEHTERALNEVAALIEPCRVELTSNNGNTGFGTKLMYILRDSPEIMVSLVELGLAGRRLHEVLHTLSGRQVLRNPSWSSSLPEISQPPTYEESQFLTQRRAQNALRRANSNTVSQDRTERSSLATGLDGLAEDRDELGDLMDFTSSQSSPTLKHDELFFDAVAAQTSEASARNTYVPYRPARTTPRSTDGTMRTSRSLSDPNLVMSQQPHRNSLPTPAPAETMLTHEISVSASVVPNSIPLAMPDAQSFATLSRSTLSNPPPGTKGGKPPVNPKPEALRAQLTTDPLAKNASTAQPRKKRDWESLPSQLQRSSIPTFVFTCSTPGPGEPSSHPLFQNMVKLDASSDQRTDISSVRVGTMSELPELGSVRQPALESEFPEVVPESSSPQRSSDLPARPAGESGKSKPAEVDLVTEVSTDMMTRSRSNRQARLLHRANHAPEIVSWRQSSCAPELAFPIRDLRTATTAEQRRSSVSSGTSSFDNDPSSGNAASSGQSSNSIAALSRLPSRYHRTVTPPVRPYSVQSAPETGLLGARSQGMNQSLGIDREQTTTPESETLSLVVKPHSTFTGRARSQKWRELQYEKSQALEKGQWFT